MFIHLIVDAVMAVFDFGSEAFIKLREQIWLSVFKEAAEQDVSLIFTFSPERTVRTTFIQLIQVTTMIGKYYTPEQQDYLKERWKLLGEEQIRQVEAQWQELIEQVRTEMKKGTDPTSEPAQVLARQWLDPDSGVYWG